MKTDENKVMRLKEAVENMSLTDATCPSAGSP